MSDLPLSSGDGTDGNQYENILERVVHQERDRDHEIRTRVRLGEWQETSIDNWRGDFNTNRVELMHALYIEGTVTMRDYGAMEVGNKILKLRKEFYNYILDNMEWAEFYHSDIMDIVSMRVDIEEFYDNLSDDPADVYIPESLCSEVKRVYKDDLFTDMSVHRVMIAIGMQSMEGLPDYYAEKAKRQEEALVDAINESADALENHVARTASDLYFNYLYYDFSDEDVRWLKEVSDLMVTEHRRRIDTIIQHLEER